MPYDNNMKGVLFKNDKKESDQHPDLKGSMEVNGVEYWLAAWANKTKEGDKYLKLSISPKDEQKAEKPEAAPVEEVEEVDEGDCMPF